MEPEALAESSLRSVDPTVVPSLRSVEPTAGPSLRSVEPTAGPSLRSVETTAGPSLRSVDPTSGPNQRSVDPTSGPNQRSVDATAGPNQRSVDPTASPNQRSVDSTAGPNQRSVDPTAGPNQRSVDTTAGPSQRSVEPTAGPSQRSVDPTAGPSSSSTSGSGVNVRIIEQPSKKAYKFRYKSEKRKPELIPGAGSTEKQKTYPAIEITNYTGKAKIIVSCVTKLEPYRPHPHNLVGENCSNGFCKMNVYITPETRVVTFSNIGIESVTTKEIATSLALRKSKNIDPFHTGFDHGKSKKKEINLNAVRLCFQVFLNRKEEILSPIVSNVVDKFELNIIDLSPFSGPAGKKTKVILVCEKMDTKDVELTLHAEAQGGEAAWSETVPGKFYYNAIVVFFTPPYRNPATQSPINAYIQLRSPSTGETSNRVLFVYEPSREPGPDYLEKKRKKPLHTVRIERLRNKSDPLHVGSSPVRYPQDQMPHEIFNQHRNVAGSSNMNYNFNPDMQLQGPTCQVPMPVQTNMSPNMQARSHMHMTNMPVTSPNFQLMSPHIQVMSSHGQVMPPQVQVMSAQGQVMLPQGQVRLGQGQIMSPQGQVIPPQVQIMSAQGQVMSPQGHVMQDLRRPGHAMQSISPGIQIMAPQGQVMSPQEQVRLGQGQIMSPQGQVIPPQVQIMSAQGQVMSPQGHVMQDLRRPGHAMQSISPGIQMLAPQGQVMSPQEQVRLGQGQIMSPQGQVMLPQVQIMSGQGQVMSPQGHVMQDLRRPGHAMQSISPGIQMLAPQGQVISPQEQVRLGQGQIMSPQGQVMLPQVQIMSAQGQVMSPQGYVMQDLTRPGHAMQSVSPGIQMLAPQGQVMPPQRQVRLGQGQIMSPQDQVMTPQGQVMSLQGHTMSPQLTVDTDRCGVSPGMGHISPNMGHVSPAMQQQQPMAQPMEQNSVSSIANDIIDQGGDDINWDELDAIFRP